MRSTQCDEVGTCVNNLATEIIGRAYLLYQRATADDGEVARMQFKFLAVKGEAARTAEAKQMCQIFHFNIRPYNTKRICNNYVFLLYHYATLNTKQKYK